MTNTSTNINQILSQYDRTQSKNHRILEERRKEIAGLIPQYYDVHHQIVSASIARSTALIHDAAVEDENAFQLKLDELSRQKKQLLLDYGYASDYLEDIYDCEHCNDTGFAGPGVKCTCLEQLIFQALLNESTLTKRFSTDSFATFDYNYYHSGGNSPEDQQSLNNIQKIVHDCKNFVNNFDSEYSNIVLMGPAGVGKTFLSNCIAQELLKKQKNIVYFSAVEFFDQLAKLSFDNGLSPSVKQKLKKHVYNCDLLILDDLGTEVTNAFVESQLFTCINERSLLKKPVLISTNLTIEEIDRIYKNRILSRIVGEYNLYNVPGDDIRIQKRLNTLKHTEEM